MIYLIFFAFISPTYAKEINFSLFLTSHECDISKKKHQLNRLDKDPNYLCLNAILYLDQENWAIWINHRKITTFQYPEDLKIVSVSPEEVQLIWLEKSQNVISLKLNKPFTFPP